MEGEGLGWGLGWRGVVGERSRDPSGGWEGVKGAVPELDDGGIVLAVDGGEDRAAWGRVAEDEFEGEVD